MHTVVVEVALSHAVLLIRPLVAKVQSHQLISAALLDPSALSKSEAVDL
jgi:hypothetical protein